MDDEIRYGGRTLKVTVLVNTDEDEQAVVERIDGAARGSKDCMSVVMLDVVDPEQAKPVWDQIIAGRAQRENSGG